MSHRRWIAYLLVIAAAALAYLPLIGGLGLYLGDVTFMWIEQGLGAGSLVPALSDDRPMVGVQFALAGALFGTDVLAWHLYMFALRAGAALALLWGLRAVFPRHVGLTTAAGVLVALYPGFLGQPMAINLQNYLGAHLLAMLSVAASLRAGTGRWRAPLILLAGACLLGYLGLLEAFIGIEALRLLLLWLHPTAPAPTSARMRWLARQYAPLLLVIAGFGVWRALLFNDDARRDTDIGTIIDLYTGEQGALIRLAAVQNFGMAIWQGGAAAWVQPLIERAGYVSLPLIALAGAGAALSLFIRPEADRRAGRTLIIVGGLSLITGLGVMALVLRPPTLIPYSSRLLMPGTAGAVLLMVGLMALLPTSAVRRGLVAALVGVSTLIHLADAALYTDHWAMQRDLWRQIRVRAPALAEGSTLVVALPARWRSFPYGAVDDEILFPLNWLYLGEPGDLRYGGMVLDAEMLPVLQAGRPYDLIFRSGWLFQRAELSRAVVVWLPETGECLRVLSPDDANLPDPLIAAAALHSRPDLIAADAPPPALPAWLGAPADDDCRISE